MVFSSQAETTCEFQFCRSQLGQWPTICLYFDWLFCQEERQSVVFGGIKLMMGRPFAANVIFFSFYFAVHLPFTLAIIVVYNYHCDLFLYLSMFSMCKMIASIVCNCNANLERSSFLLGQTLFLQLEFHQKLEQLLSFLKTSMSNEIFW